MRVLVCLLSLVVFLISGPTAYAGEPTNQIRITVDKVIDILKNKELKRPEKTKERRSAIRKTVLERFDFEEMAKRSLALHWSKRTPEEKKEFVSLYTDLLERSYIKKIENYSDEKVVYLDEKTDGENSIVKTKMITKNNTEIPVDYKLAKLNSRWNVYDISVEGVSLVNNYRNQFNKIIRSHINGYAELLKMMRSKQEDEAFEEKKK
ncbi:MAG: ABC transporter substrate-binding protein [Nitrospirae bacterium]|nr:MAG: ABC transporter substrate-binding protein [Nitrospirota bacterium]